MRTDLADPIPGARLKPSRSRMTHVTNPTYRMGGTWS